MYRVIIKHGFAGRSRFIAGNMIQPLLRICCSHVWLPEGKLVMFKSFFPFRVCHDLRNCHFSITGYHGIEPSHTCCFRHFPLCRLHRLCTYIYIYIYIYTIIPNHRFRHISSSLMCCWLKCDVESKSKPCGGYLEKHTAFPCDKLLKIMGLPIRMHNEERPQIGYSTHNHLLPFWLTMSAEDPIFFWWSSHLCYSTGCDYFHC